MGYNEDMKTTPVAEEQEETQGSPAQETVIILDFGAQYSQLIARRVREEHVYSEVLPYDVPWEEVEKRDPAAFILTGGPESVVEASAPHIPPQLLDAGKPVLG